MFKLPVIVGFGGINAAGRSAFHHGYLRTIYSHISQQQQHTVRQSLAQLMKLDSQLPTTQLEQHILDGTLIRAIEKSHFDRKNVYTHHKASTQKTSGNGAKFYINKNNVPPTIPTNWSINPCLHDKNKVQVQLNDNSTVLLPTQREIGSQAAGQLPTGLQIDTLYNARNHPRGIQMALFAMSDALGDLGLDWDELSKQVDVDQISVYAGSACSQLDTLGNGGLLQARLLGKRPSSKNLALGLADMPAAFINAYVLGNAGTTGNMMGACATFLYNLKQAVHDIQSGRARIAVVGASEAPITPEIIEGFTAMGALINDQGLRDMNNGIIDYRTASRPFAENKGFVIGEAAHCIVLMDDALALQTGAKIHAAVPSVHVNADAYKKSIPSPGIGNYITVSKAISSARSILGDKAIQDSYMVAHGTSTPQNRVTEAAIFSEVAKAQGIKQWQITAPKAYIGHSVAAAAGDQLASVLGAWEYGYLPGIITTSKIASDVPQDQLDFILKTQQIEPTNKPIAFLNSKGFGGNNASATILSPFESLQMIKKRYGERMYNAYLKTQENVQKKRLSYEQKTLTQHIPLRYIFGENVTTPADIQLSKDTIYFKNTKNQVNLTTKNPYSDMV